MSEINTVAIEDSLIALKERKRLLDDVWLLTLFVIFIAIGLPWYLRVLEIDLAPVAWSVFGYGVSYLVTALVADGLRSYRFLLIVIGILQETGVLFIGFVWHLTGSVQNPMFLLVFVLPVVAGSLVLVSWQPYATALLSVATVVAVALIDAPELRWYVTQTILPAKWLIGLLPGRSPSTPQPFPSLDTPPSYLFMLLVSFAVFLPTVALMAEYLTSLLLRLYGRLASSAHALKQAESLSLEVLRASPSPAALVYVDTFNIAHANQSFMQQLLQRPESLLDKNLFGLIDFSYPEVVEDLIVGNGGEVPLAVYRVDGETRVARVRVCPIKHGGVRYAYLNIQDMSDLHYLQAALNAVDEVLVVMSASRQILYFNQAAKDLLGDLQLGMNAEILLKQANLPEGWWELGKRSRQERRVEFSGKRYRASCVAARIPGERDTLTVLNLQSVGSDQ